VSKNQQSPETRPGLDLESAIVHGLFNESISTEANAGALCPVEEYRPIDAALAELRQRFAGVVYNVAATAGMKAAREARAELRTHRTTLEKRRQEIKAPALERCRLIDAEAKRITGELRALEDPIDRQIEAEEQRREAERLERLARERARMAEIQARIMAISDAVSRHAASRSNRIAVAIDELRSTPLTEDAFGDMLPLARAAAERTLAQLCEMHQAAITREEQAEALAAERARLAAEAAERERAEAEAHAVREAERLERLARERARMAETHARIMRELAEREEALRRDEEATIAARRQVEEMQRQQEAEARARREAEAAARAAAEAEARRKRIAAATLESAALSAVALLEEHGLGQHEVTLSLRVALGLSVDLAPDCGTEQGRG
jgi:hypothetical protein